MRSDWRLLAIALFAAGCGPEGPTLTVTGISPESVVALGGPFDLSIFGRDFHPLVRGNLSDPSQSALDVGFRVTLRAPTGSVESAAVAWVNDTELVARIAAPLVADAYAVEVIDPRGHSASMMNALTAVDRQPREEFVWVTTESPSGGCLLDPDCEPAGCEPAEAGEVIGDGVDGDCDGEELCYVDLDGDGFRTADSTRSGDLDCDDPGEARAEAPLDCDDEGPAAASRYPGAPEGLDDGINQDCDGQDLLFVIEPPYDVYATEFETDGTWVAEADRIGTGPSCVAGRTVALLDRAVTWSDIDIVARFTLDEQCGTPAVRVMGRTSGSPACDSTSDFTFCGPNGIELQTGHARSDCTLLSPLDASIPALVVGEAYDLRFQMRNAAYDCVLTGPSETDQVNGVDLLPASGGSIGFSIRDAMVSFQSVRVSRPLDQVP